MIRLLIVDDSALMRRQLTGLFESLGGFEIRTARNGREAIEENRAFEPDVVTLDINMPEMDGLTALVQIMADRPVPVVMVSSLTERGALASFEALALGAVDYVAKPGGTISLSIDEIRKELAQKVLAATRARVGAPRPSARPARPRPTPAPRAGVAAPRAQADGVVVIGVSTGGPRTLEEVLPRLPADFPWPVLVVQHMPGTFTRAFASRINEQCALEVVEVATPMKIEPGTVYIAKGGADMVVVDRAGVRTAMPRPEAAEHLWHPSVELLGRSVLAHWNPRQVVAVMLTGMGHDGADAFHQLYQRGARTIAESKETAVVFGMPAELIARGAASVVLPAPQIADQVIAWSQSL